MSRARRYTRWILELALIVLMVGSLSLVGLARFAPALGHPVFIIDSGSMTPTIPVGAAVLLDPGSVGARTGDVVTLRSGNGAIFTHRLTRLTTLNGVPYMETKGDANATADPALTPLDHVMGRVVLTLPLVGFDHRLARHPDGHGERAARRARALRGAVAPRRERAGTQGRDAARRGERTGRCGSCGVPVGVSCRHRSC